MIDNCTVVRIHLKTGGTEGAVDRAKLIDFCLHNKDSQYVAVGWSCAHDDASFDIESFDDFYKAVQEWNIANKKRMNAAINVFSTTKENDLFWTRDIDGNHWICRAKGPAIPYYDAALDIGVVVPVEAYLYGIDVPGQIRSSFTRAMGGITQTFYDELITVFSQYVFNNLSGRNVYTITPPTSGDILDNLPPFELEELVISYIQIKEGYYLLSNSIASNSTTIKIECEFRSRDKNDPKRAVVQVKGGRNYTIDASEYNVYDNNGYFVYFFAPEVINLDSLNNGIWISRDELLNFYHEYKSVLPDSITKWESLFNL